MSKASFFKKHCEKCYDKSTYVCIYFCVLRQMTHLTHIYHKDSLWCGYKLGPACGGQLCQVPRSRLSSGLILCSHPALSAWSMNAVIWAKGLMEKYRDIPAPHGPTDIYRGHWCTLQICQSPPLRLIMWESHQLHSKIKDLACAKSHGFILNFLTGLRH